jgi:hypothetical protein
MEPSRGSHAPRQEPDRVPAPYNASAAQSEIPVKVKKEEPEDDRVDAALAIFDDVDDYTEDEGPELVDGEYVGLVEQNGAKCWVCPGSCCRMFPACYY